MKGKPVSLPDVTVIVLDCVAHELARLAIEDTLREITPKVVLVFSDYPQSVESMSDDVGCSVIGTRIDPMRSIGDVEQFLWSEIPAWCDTSHTLVIQYDGFVLDGSLWRDEWLRYDYIGALWPWHKPGEQVGNGGFSLRSTKLMRHLADNPDRYPVRTPEDDTLCRAYRPFLEAEGFRWASVEDASAFSFEREKPHRTFGFHGVFNYPNVMSPERLAERQRLASDCVRNKVEWEPTA